MVYIVIRSWFDNSILEEFEVQNTTIEKEIENSNKIHPKQYKVIKNKLVLFV